MENTPTVVKEEELTLPQPSEGDIPAGSKTDSTLLLKSLQEEREKRREIEESKKLLEEELLTIKQSDEIFSDEGKVLKKEVDSLRETVASLGEDNKLQAIFLKYPLLKEKVDEFNEYRKQYSGVALENVAKLYLSEIGLLETTPKRKGLEKSTGGDRTPISSGKMTSEEVKKLRETNYRKYQEMLKKDQIKIS